MPLRLLPWAPEYGTAMQFDADDDAAGPSVAVDATVERPDWVAVDPAGEPPLALQVVDGVRRAEAHAMDDGPDGEPLLGLFASFAVGVVRCLSPRGGGAGAASVAEDRIRVERRYFQSGGDPLDRGVVAGTSTLTFRAETPPGATSANALVSALNDAMLDEEAKLAQEISRDESTLTLVDGPLSRVRAPGRRTVGYVKRIHNWYVDGDRRRLLPLLATGQRTPVMRLVSDGGQERYSWFLRMADLGRRFHPLGAVMRLEAPGALPPSEAIALADQSSLALPPLASSPVRDPRAPQNLTPVGALESVLTRRMGDRLWLRRALLSAVGEGADAVAAASALVRDGPQ